MLSAALVVFALHRPAPAPVVTVAQPPVQTVAAASPGLTEADVQARIDAAVARLEIRQKAQLKQVNGDLEGARQRLILAQAGFEYFDYNSKRDNAHIISAGLMAPPGVGEPK
jgi:hypothetical protein